MEMQALTMATWGANVNVKIPVTNRAGVFMGPLIRRLAEAGVALNVTAILTLEQVRRVADGADAGTCRRSCRCSRGASRTRASTLYR